MSVYKYKDFTLRTDEDRSPKTVAFIADIVVVCRKHNLGLGHEDSEGAFEVGSLSEDVVQWIEAAHEVTPTQED